MILIETVNFIIEKLLLLLSDIIKLTIEQLKHQELSDWIKNNNSDTEIKKKKSLSLKFIAIQAQASINKKLLTLVNSIVL